MITYILDKIALLCPNLINKLAVRFCPYDLTNLNLDLTNLNQKKVLICYLRTFNVNMFKLNHAAYAQLNQILLYFIKKGYCIDLCDCLDMKAFNRLKENKYDIMLGFGSVFKAFSLTGNVKFKILYMTENNPDIVKEKYNERIQYFNKRHPLISVKKSVLRNQYFDREQLNIADCAIMMSSDYNASSVRRIISNVWTINSNVLLNKTLNINELVSIKNVAESRFNLLWFGSLGFIHKGLDILLDVLKILPDYTLNCYGISQSEISLFQKLSSKNTHNKGFINVWEEKFIVDVVMKHNFMIFPSCSEGMSTAVTTCMTYGIIPIITKETGIESNSCIIELEDYKIETIHKTIRELEKMSDIEIYEKRKLCSEYARENFSLENFDKSFSEIMDNITKKYRL